MTLAQIQNRPQSVAEWMEFFTAERVKDLKKSAQRLIKTIADDDTDDEKCEIYGEIYDELPKSKKKKKTEKTPEEMEEEERAIQRGMLNKINEHKKLVWKKCPKTESDDGKFSVKEFSSKDLLSLLTDEERKEWNAAKMKIGKYLLAIEMEKIISKKASKGNQSEPARTRTDADNEAKNKTGLTGEEIRCENMNKRKDGEEYEKIQSFKVVDHLTKDNHGIRLEDGEACLYNFSSEEINQVQRKPAMRKTPIDEVIGCFACVKPNFAGAVWKINEDGVYEKVKKDWGMFPCNMKCVDGLNVCSRHHKAKVKPTEWTREMLKVEEKDIINKE